MLVPGKLILLQMDRKGSVDLAEAAFGNKVRWI